MTDHNPVAAARAYLEKGCGEPAVRGIIAEIVAEIEALRLLNRVNAHDGRRFEFRAGQIHERIDALRDGRLREEPP